MLHRYLNAKEVVDRPILVTYMLGPDAYESETLTDIHLKDIGSSRNCGSRYKLTLDSDLWLT